MAELSRCDDCYAQVEPMDWYGHRMWHKDQEDALSDLLTNVENVDNTQQMQAVADQLDNDLIPRLEKIEGLAAIFDAFAEKQLQQSQDTT